MTESLDHAEVLKSVQYHFVTSLTVILIWLISWPTAQEKLTVFHESKDFHTWLFLRQEIEELLAKPNFNIFEYPEDESIDIITIKNLPTGPQHNEELEEFTLAVHTTWPEVAEIPLVLVPRKTEESNVGRIYDCKSSDKSAQFGDYAVVVLNTKKKVFVVSRDNRGLALTGTLRGYMNLEHGVDQPSMPKSWISLEGYLRRNGFTGTVEQIRPDDAALAKFQAELDPRQTKVKVLGLDLTLGTFIAAIGIVLAAVAFSMVGPALSLSELKQVTPATAWILTIPIGHNVLRRVLEGLILLITLAWAAAPSALAIMLMTVKIDYEIFPLWATVISVIGLVFSSAVFVAIAIQLARVRMVNP